MPTRSESIAKAAARIGRTPSELLALLHELGETRYTRETDAVAVDLIDQIKHAAKLWIRLWPTTALFVRHADYDGGGGDPPLNALGLARAADLARVACRAGVSAIFSTNTQRTLQTAQPLAAAKGIETQIYADPEALAGTIKGTYAGRVVLVVGHSAGTQYLGTLIDALVGTHVPGVSVDGFQNLFVVTRFGSATGSFNWKMLNLQYGQAAACTS